MNIAEVVDRVFDYWVDIIPMAIWSVIKWVGWVAFIFPVVVIGYVSQFVIARLVAGFMVGWMAARDD